MAQAIGIRIGEAMLGTVKADKFIVSPGLVHFRLERRDVIRRNHAVQRAMLDQNLRFHTAGRRRGFGCQRTVETHHARQRLSLARRVQHHRTAEAVTDGGNFIHVGLRLLLQQIQPGLEALAGSRRILARGLHERHRVFRVLSVLAFAVHINGQGAVAEFGQIPRAALGVIVQAPPFMHHDDTRTLAFDGVVIGVVADQLCAIGTLVGNFLGLDRSLSKAADGQQGEGKEQAHGRIS
ncbi:hypothetical protein PS619_06278 [Pseudomonas fluorescens]|nr:hypothetical protein PS619_06278 [Pseudomonas fluorescens]